MTPRMSNPVENLRTYLMVHRGIDVQERTADVEWLEDVWKQGKLLKSLLVDVLAEDIDEDLKHQIRNAIEDWNRL